MREREPEPNAAGFEMIEFLWLKIIINVFALSAPRFPSTRLLSGSGV